MASIPIVFFASAIAVNRMVQAEYRSGVRLSTNGDSAGIPAGAITVVWAGLLLIGALVWAAVRFRQRKQRVG